MEEGQVRVFPMAEGRRIPRKDPIAIFIHVFGLLLKVLGLFSLGKQQAKKINIKENFVKSPKLGEGTVSILHLSDLHLDEWPHEFEKILWSLKECGEYNFCVITGDLATGWPLQNKDLEAIKALISAIKTPIFYVLGNHDSYHMVDFLEAQGVCVLTNQIHEFIKGAELPFDLDLIGTDDPHYFFQRDALRILQEGRPEKFQIALVHTPELYDIAQKNHIDLYLCGHTHGGQIALPGGFAPMRRVYRGKRFYRGAWEYKGMKGYTSSGLGTSSLPVRFFTGAEMTLHHISGMRS